MGSYTCIYTNTCARIKKHVKHFLHNWIFMRKGIFVTFGTKIYYTKMRPITANKIYQSFKLNEELSTKETFNMTYSTIQELLLMVEFKPSYIRSIGFCMTKTIQISATLHSYGIICKHVTLLWSWIYWLLSWEVLPPKVTHSSQNFTLLFSKYYHNNIEIVIELVSLL